MFLSSFIKTQKNSTYKVNSTLSLSKNYLNPFIKTQVKHVSRSLTSRENREKYDLKKMDDYWELVDKDVNRRMEIMKQIEEKYKTKSEILISNSRDSKNEIKEIYFVPLINTDENILNNFFNKEKQDDIRKGGRLVLLDEVNKFNKNNPFNKISFDYEPLEYQDFQKIKKQYNILMDNKEYFIIALQQGKKILEFLESFREYKDDLQKNLNKNFRLVEHLEAVENSHPLRNNIEININKIETSNWIKNLFRNNKIDEKILGKKFNKIYLDLLDCLNREAAYARGYDIEIVDKTSDKKKTNAVAINKIQQNIENIQKLFYSISDSKEVEKIFSSIENDEFKQNEDLSDVKNDTDMLNKYEEKVEKNSSEDFEENDNYKVYAYDENKDYRYVFDKNPSDLTFDEIEYIRAEKEFEEENYFNLINSSHLGKLLSKLYKAKEELSNLLCNITKNESNNNNNELNIHSNINESEINKIIAEVKSIVLEDKVKDKKDVQNNIIEKDSKSTLKFPNNPKEYLKNRYYDIIQFGKNSKDMKIPISVKDKETYILNALMKYCADVIQSKEKKFNKKELRLEYFGEKLKSYEIFDNYQNIKDNNMNNEETSNPENYFTPNFKSLVEHLDKKHGLVEISVKYPFNVMNLSHELYGNDELSREILRFYLEKSNDKNLLSEKDQEKVLNVVEEYLNEKIENNTKNHNHQDKGILIY